MDLHGLPRQTRMEVENMSNKFHAPRRGWQEIGYQLGWVFVILQFYNMFQAAGGGVAYWVIFVALLAVFFFAPDPVEFHYWWKHRNEINHEKL